MRPSGPATLPPDWWHERHDTASSRRSVRAIGVSQLSISRSGTGAWQRMHSSCLSPSERRRKCGSVMAWPCHDAFHSA